MDATERLNLDALREALAQYDEYADLQEWSFVAPLAEAARLVAEGQPVWWCEEHERLGTDMECSENGMGRRACRMVEVLLVKGAEGE